MRNVFGSYVILGPITDDDEIFEKVAKALPDLVHQAQRTNHAIEGALDLDTLEFIVHTQQSGLMVTVGWKCWEKDASVPGRPWEREPGGGEE